ncbi:reverse transcriptase [Cucumis melo var. makuwa]|uniref:Reverse transcriptase n=1 Tax=Cucumis melo var. makuwa TaxID=1194695 RepID=A0A5D3DE20_CUCMM|nr:reverse transcriptase [Cucumis melo var. makuwa]
MTPRSSVLSLKKRDKNPQQCIKHCILNKFTASRKYPFPILPNLFDRLCGVKYFSKSDIRSRYCRVRATKVKGLETTCVTRRGAYEFPIVPFSLTDAIATSCVTTNHIFQDHLQKSFRKLEENQSVAKGGRCCLVQGQINILGHMVEFYRIDFVEELLKRASSLIKLLKEDIQWGGNPDCQVTFNGLKQSMNEGSSLGVADATKPSKDEAERFNFQFDKNTQTDSLIRRIQFEINGSRHSILSPLANGPYVGNNPQVYRDEKEWEQMVDIARVCLEEASRSMEERVDQKGCPLEFEWMTKLPVKM